MVGRGKHQVCTFHRLPSTDLLLQREKEVTILTFRATKIFVTLANFLGTRTPRQCRSHFQKLMTKFRKINKIRAHYESILGPLEYARRTIEVSQLFKEKDSRVEPPLKELKSFEVQTEPMNLRLSDLQQP